VAKIFLILCFALISFGSQPLGAADKLQAALEQLAARIESLGAPGDSFQVELASLLGARLPSEKSLRALVESALRARSIRLAEDAPGSAKLGITFSRNTQGALIVARVQRGEEVRVLLLPFDLEPPALVAGRIERRLLWTHSDPILDLAATESELWALVPGALLFHSRQANQWTLQRRLEIALPRPWPRDLRGMLHEEGESLEAYLPGVLCRVEKASFRFGCQESTAQWPLQSGAVSLRASFEAGRNYFSGFTAVGATAHSFISPFYTASVVRSDLGELWLVTRPDGNAYLHSRAPETAVVQKEAGIFGFRNDGEVAAIPGWGSDMAVLASACQSRSVALATQSSDEKSDEVHAYVILNRELRRLAGPAEFPGPVTALWPRPDGSAVAVAHDRSSGLYAAYRLQVSCE
jgi:hypothetical protein